MQCRICLKAARARLLCAARFRTRGADYDEAACVALLGVAQGLAQTSGAPLTVELQRALKPADRFKECEKCPELLVVPAGNFMMGSPEAVFGNGPGEFSRLSRWTLT